MRIYLNLKNVQMWIILIFIILLNSCFYLVKPDQTFIGNFTLTDISLVILFFYFVAQTYKYKQVKTNYMFGHIIIILCMLVFVSAFQQKMLTGQRISLGIMPQRYYFAILLSYFPLRKMFYKNKINEDKLINCLFILGIFFAILCIFQKIVIGDVKFLNVMMNSRNDSDRLYTDSMLIQLSALIATYRFCDKYKVKYFLALMLCLIYEFWISQGRLEIISVVGAIVIGVFMTRKFSLKKMIMLIVVCICIMVALMSNYANNIWEIALNSENTNISDNTMAIRYEGRELYWKQLNESTETFLFGCGYPNKLWNKAAEKAGYFENINLNDNGIFGFMYIYGFVGVLMILFLLIKSIYLSLKIYKMNGNTVPIMFVLMNAFLAYNIIFWYWKKEGIFILVLMLVMMENNVRNNADKIIQVHSNSQKVST